MKVRTVNFRRTKTPPANLKATLFNVLKDQRKRWRDAQRGLWNHIPRPRKRKSRTVLDSGFHALNSRYWIPNLCQRNLDSWFHSLVGFRIPNFPDSEIRITWGEYPSTQKNIQLFRERLSGKVHATILKGIVGGFEFSVFQRDLKQLARKAMEMCLRVLKESNKSMFDSYSRHQEQCIDHIPYYLSGLSRAHFSDNLSRNSCIHIYTTIYTFLWEP